MVPVVSQVIWFYPQKPFHVDRTWIEMWMEPA